MTKLIEIMRLVTRTQVLEVSEKSCHVNFSFQQHERIKIPMALVSSLSAAEQNVSRVLVCCQASVTKQGVQQIP